MSRPYFLLLQRGEGVLANEWFMEFGDFDRETVHYELVDYVDHDTPRRNLKIVQAKSARPVDCNAALAKANREIRK